MLWTIAINTFRDRACYALFVHNGTRLTISTRHSDNGRYIIIAVYVTRADGSLFEHGTYTVDSYCGVKAMRRALRTILSFVG
jgi:hypothetical protein